MFNSLLNNPQALLDSLIDWFIIVFGGVLRYSQIETRFLYWLSYYGKINISSHKKQQNWIQKDIESGRHTVPYMQPGQLHSDPVG